MVGVPVAAVDEQVELGGGDRADRHADPFRTTTGERSSSLAGNVEHEVLGTERQLATRSEEHTSELQPLMRTSYAVFCLNKKKQLVHKNTYSRATKLKTWTST